jgi:hypothetical protein
MSCLTECQEIIMDWEGRIWRSPIDGKRVRITGPFIHSHQLMNDDDGDDDVNQQM